MEELIRKMLAAAVGITLVPDAGTAAPIAAVPDGVQLKSLEQLLPAPLRTVGTTRLHQYPAFVAYVNKYKTPDGMIFVAPDIAFRTGGTLAHAVLDFPAPDKPSWSGHCAELIVQPSIEYKMLTDLDGKLLEQDVFARSMLNLARFCTSMSAADLLELAQKLTLTSKGAFRSINDDLSGSVSVAYDVQVSAKVDSGTTTKNIDVPSSISFNLPMLLGGSPVSINADLLYRIPDEAGGKIKLGIRLPDRVYVERDVLEALVAQLSTDTNLAVAVGSSDVPDLPGDFS